MGRVAGWSGTQLLVPSLSSQLPASPWPSLSCGGMMEAQKCSLFMVSLCLSHYAVSSFLPLGNTSPMPKRDSK